MSKRYSPEQRQTVLQLLDANRGDITLTSLQAGISERTLYDWRRKRGLLQQQQLPPQDLLQSLSSLQQQQNDSDEYDVLRDRMMRTALTIADSLNTNVDSRSLNVRVRALTSLLDRIMHLDSDRLAASRTETLQIEFVDQTGKITSTPHWATTNDDESKSPHWLYQKGDDSLTS